MQTGTHALFLGLALLACATGCKKEHTGPALAASPYIAIQIDTAFIMAPNVVTPNGDGINDAFMVVVTNITTLNTTVLHMNGDTAFHSTSLHPVWSDLDSTDLGRYSVTIHGVSTSGHDLYGNGLLDLLDYHGEPCLPYSGTPVTGDQFDPRVFGVSYPSNDIICE